MFRILNLFFCIVLMSSCGIHETDDKCFVVKEIQEKAGEIPISGLEMDITYIPLEFINEFPVGKIFKIIAVKEFIFIICYEYILQYDLQGNFIRNIGTKGNGPGEYLNILDVSVDGTSEKIYVADLLGLKVIEYQLSTGRHLEQYRYEPFWWKFESDHGYFLVNPLNIPGNMKGIVRYKLLKMDFHMDTLFKSLNNNHYNTPEDKSFVVMPDTKVFQKYGNEILFRQSFNDTLYTFKDKELTIRYYFDFGKQKFPVHLLGDDTTYDKEVVNYGFLKDVTECEKYIFIEIYYKGNIWKYIINKLTNEIYNAGKDGIIIHEHEIYFWPKWCYEKNYTIDYLPADMLIEKIDQLSDTKLQSIASELNEESNPVIVIARF